jgi:hypothetical protein
MLPPSVPTGYAILPTDIICQLWRLNAKFNAVFNANIDPTTKATRLQVTGFNGTVQRMSCKISKQEKYINLESKLVSNDFVKTKDFGDVILLVILITPPEPAPFLEVRTEVVEETFTGVYTLESGPR